jgi:hypothetical protein
MSDGSTGLGASGAWLDLSKKIFHVSIGAGMNGFPCAGGTLMLNPSPSRHPAGRPGP